MTKRDARGMPLSSSSRPALMAKMLELLDLRPGDRVLEIGAGTGYNAALLAHIVGSRGRVRSLDIDDGLVRQARRVLRETGYRASIKVADGRGGANGTGGPLGLRADAIPRTVRVLAVAQRWSALTAHGTAQLSHQDALVQLQIAAGTRFDPAVVSAARAVLSQERVSATEPAPEPRLHHLRIPAPVRRALADP